MITLITGVPGAGKTAYALSALLEELQARPRPLYVMGVPDLQIPHEPVPPLAEWVRDVPNPDDPSVLESKFTFADGSLIFIDEAQKIFRPRATGSKVPAAVAALETHRHTGLDIYLVTQSPTLIDSNVRKLVGRHIHLRNTWVGRRLHEWSEVCDPNSRSDRSASVARPYTLPRRVFGLYTSATLHTKQDRRKPAQLYIIAALLLIGSFAAYYLYGSISKKINPAASPLPASAIVDDSVLPDVIQPLPSAPAGISPADFVPRIPTRPETAPLYDAIRVVSSMPRVAGCIADESRCECFTQQATSAFLSEGQCREWMRVRPFDPWRKPIAPAQPQTERAQDVMPERQAAR